MLHRIHTNSRHSWPAIPLHLVFMICSSCFQHWFLQTTTACHHSYHCCDETNLSSCTSVSP